MMPAFAQGLVFVSEFTFGDHRAVAGKRAALEVELVGRVPNV